MASWLDKYNDDVPNAQNGIEGTMGGLTDKGFNYNGAWGGTMQGGGYAPKTERKLIKKYVDPVQKRAIERAKKQGINTGLHNGPLDAIRHASSAAATSSILPSWANLVPGVLPLNIAATNIAGLVHEINSPNNWKERSSDLYNNFIGSIAGVLPISEENKHNLLIQAQKYNVLSNLGNKETVRAKHEMGGSIPGSVGFTYARTQSPAPSNGPYAKKTKASAQNGQEMKFYQEGLDWKPKNISRDGGWLSKYDDETKAQQGLNTSRSELRPATNNFSDKAKWAYNQFMHSRPVETIQGIAPVLKALDPTGITNWPDLFKAVKSGNNEDIGIEGLASIPLVGKPGKVVKWLDEISTGAKTGIPFFKTMRISGSTLSTAKDFKKEEGGIIEDPMGQWAHPGEITRIPSNEITMQGVDYPVLGISDTGDTKMMKPGKDYKFKGKSVTEVPMMQEGGKADYNKLPYDKETDSYIIEKPLDEVVITDKSNSDIYAKSDNTRFGQPPKFSKLEVAYNKYRMEQAERDRQLELSKKGQDDFTNAISDLGTGLAVEATQFRFPTQEEYEAGRSGDWLQRAPILANALGYGLVNEMTGGAMEALPRGLSSASRFISKQKPLLDKAGNVIYDSLLQPIDEMVVAPIQFRNETKVLKNKFSDILDRYQSDPEAARRLTQTLGITPEQLGSPKLTFKSGVGSSYSPKGNSLNIDFRQVEGLKKLGYELSDETILEHEWNHYLQKRAYEVSPEYKTLVDEYYNNLDFYNSEKSKVGPLKFKIDNFFSNNPLKKPDYPVATSMPTSVDYELLNAFGNPDLIRQPLTRRGAEDLAYFLDGEAGSKGLKSMLEPMPHLGEMRQNMLNRGIIKNRYQPITEENIYQFLSNPNGDRISRFASHKNPETIKALADAFKILPASIPVGVVASTQLPEEKNGGWLNKYE